MITNSKWRAQCASARKIRHHFGPEVAADYLVGEKFLPILRTAGRRPDQAAEATQFARKIQLIFEPGELKWYFASERARFRAACAMGIGEEPATRAKAALLLDQAKYIVLENGSITATPPTRSNAGPAKRGSPKHSKRPRNGPASESKVMPPS